MEVDGRLSKIAEDCFHKNRKTTKKKFIDFYREIIDFCSLFESKSN